ncbi:MAG: GerMN domain-containing protein [Synergistaceae bacterium]|jgi:hypothetical protein|nr:GerMN domain-containing protein [Synergistaceae bacterium]
MARRKSDGYSERYREEMLEREFEERVKAKRKRSPRHSSSSQKRGKKTRAPLLLRVLAWCGVILLCFVVGYLGASSLLRLLDERVFERKIEVGSGGVEEGVRGTNFADIRLDMQKTTLSLFYPKEGVLKEEKVEIISRTFEGNIQDAVHKLLSLSNLFSNEVYVKHVFRNVDTVYLDFSGPFISALNTAGNNFSTQFITGIVHTMRDNFHPISKVRFLVDSKIVSSGAPVDLAVVWQLPR